MQTKVLIVGCNPSQKSPDNTPFHSSTRSRKVIDGWFSEIDADVCFMNIYNGKTHENRPPSLKSIKNPSGDVILQLMSFKNHKIVTVGKVAESVLNQLGLSFLAMPHPSGRNRLLNDPKYVEGKIKTLRDYLSV